MRYVIRTISVLFIILFCYIDLNLAFPTISLIVLIVSGVLCFKKKNRKNAYVILFLLSSLFFVVSFPFTNNYIVNKTMKNCEKIISDVEDFRKVEGKYPENLELLYGKEKHKNFLDRQIFYGKRVDSENKEYFYIIITRFGFSRMAYYSFAGKWEQPGD